MYTGVQYIALYLLVQCMCRYIVLNVGKEYIIV